MAAIEPTPALKNEAAMQTTAAWQATFSHASAEGAQGGGTQAMQTPHRINLTVARHLAMALRG